jgi:hypothetical protein
MPVRVAVRKLLEHFPEDAVKDFLNLARWSACNHRRQIVFELVVCLAEHPTDHLEVGV